MRLGGCLCFSVFSAVVGCYRAVLPVRRWNTFVRCIEIAHLQTYPYARREYLCTFGGGACKRKIDLANVPNACFHCFHLFRTANDRVLVDKAVFQLLHKRRGFGVVRLLSAPRIFGELRDVPTEQYAYPKRRAVGNRHSVFCRFIAHFLCCRALCFSAV